MLGHRQRDDDLLALPRLVEPFDRAAADEPVGQVVGDVAHALEPQLAQRFRQLGADAVERLGLGEQGVEEIGPHPLPLARTAARL